MFLNAKSPSYISVLNKKQASYLLALAIVLSSNTAIAQHKGPLWRSTPLFISQNHTISREDAARIAKQGRKIKVLKVKKNKTPTGPVFKVKLLTKNGRVKYERVNAITGEILGK